KEEKIVMTLGAQAPAPTKVPEPLSDPLAPQMVDDAAYGMTEEVPMPQLIDAENDTIFLQQPIAEEEMPKEEKEPPVHMQLKIKEDENAEFENEKKELDAKKQALNDKFEQLRQNIIGKTTGQASQQNTFPQSAAPGSYPVRPSNIYSEPKKEVSTSKTEDANQAPVAKMNEEESFNMQMVIKNEVSQADEQKPKQTQLNTPPAEDPAPQDKAEDEKRKAAERLQKLRNLSFNINHADPNNEFEAVPAYIRRNMELHNSNSNVENFYSNYSVQPGDNNQAQISTINTFLDGKKPD
ncbi:MAG: hypothetical protein ABIN57_12520, partial [Chitinophagaceae bacterium]